MKRGFYPPEAIDWLKDLLSGQKEKAKMLAAAGFPELAILPDALGGNETVLLFFREKKIFWISAFLEAIREKSKSSVDFLLKTGMPHWAAAANYINKDKAAGEWLRRNRLLHYAELAELLAKRMQDDEGTGFEFLYKGPYSQ